MKHEKLIKNIVIGALLAVIFWFGIKPLITGDSYRKYVKNVTADKFSFGENEYAVIVIGSEPEGIAAAVASARTGLKTLLITEDADPGSYIKASMIAEMNPDVGMIGGKEVTLNNGIYGEIFGKLKVGFSPDDYIATVKSITDREKNLQILYGCSLQEVLINNRKVDGIRISCNGGEKLLSAGVFIDATQNGYFLDMCKVPYTRGSEDINVPKSYMPVQFNFMISGVKWEDLSKIDKTSDFAEEFKLLLMRYSHFDNRTKIESPSFIKQDEDAFIITGLEQWGVNVDDPADMKKAYDDAMDEALMLTSYLKSALIPFSGCTFREAPEKLFVPEYRHYKGRYELTVADIMENRDFKDKIALASSPVDAGKFVGQGFEYTIVDPLVYAIPLGSIIPVNLDNVLMPGSKASFRSLAATSAGALPTDITVGESAGLTAAYCFIGGKMPADLLKAADDELKSFESYLKSGGIVLEDFSEKISDPSTKQPLESSWAYAYIRELAEYGLIAGGSGNDFRIDSQSSCDVLAVLMKNTILKMAPDKYSLELDSAMKAYEKPEPLKGETACEIMLDALGRPYDKGNAFETAQSQKLIPPAIAGMVSKDSAVTMGVVYCLAVETADLMK